MAALPNAGITPIWQMSVGQYHAMIDNGILGPDDPVELLDGVIVQKMSKNPRHSFVTRASRRALARTVPAGWFVDDQEPITLSASEPEPDLAVIRGDVRDYVARHPGPADVGLVVEVADASLDRDRIVKRRIYATAGIPWFWLIDLVNRRLEVYSGPQPGNYIRCDVYGPDDTVPVVLDDAMVGAVLMRDILP